MAGTPSLSTNVAYNVGGYAIAVLVALLLTPITLSVLGDARYGAWSLVNELIGYYGLLDLGLRGAVTYYVARSVGQSQDAVLKHTVASGFGTLAALGLVALAIGIGLTIAFPYLFAIDGLDVRESQVALFIMSCLICISLPMSALTGALVGKQRFDVTLRLEIVNRILTAAATYVVLKAGGGLVELALVQVAGRAYYWMRTLLVCREVFGTTFIRLMWFRRERAKDLVAYGSRNATTGIALMVIYRMDLTIVAVFAGMAQVAYYTIGGMLVTYASSLCSSLTYAFTPKFAQLDANNATDELHRLLLTGMRMIGLVVTALVAGMLVYGSDFISLWLGSDYVTGDWTERSDVIMALLIIANLPRMLQSISWQFLYGIGAVRFLMWLNVCEAALNLGLSLLLVRHYGPAGVAIGTLIPLLLSHVLAMPIYTARRLGISVLHLFRAGLAVPIATGLGFAGIAMLSKAIIPVTTWATFSIGVLFTIAVGGLLCYGVGLKPDERRQIRTMLAAMSPIRSVPK